MTTYKEWGKFAIKATLLYLLFYFANQFFMGIRDKGGLIEIPANLSFFDPIQWIRMSLIKPVYWICSLMGKEVYIHKHGLYMVGKGVININYSCLGIMITATLISLMAFYPGRYKWHFMLLGIISIYILNILRILFVFLYSARFPSQAAFAHEGFNTIMYILILVYFFVWTQKYSTILKKYN